MRFKPNYFQASKPVTPFKWVMDNCTVLVATKEQRDFIDSPNGQKLMDQLFDSQNKDQYIKVARQIEEQMESLASDYNLSLGYQ
ncbi:hypothetical protein [Legionella maioricensis]|uniref:Uncharacterized protein n=1 Tax=Legionella maioricensis TaxID=2896528 RepID=A0A9X2I9S4_9GAMM|nr:hypothetical protein [Legionella maioricensis]MCL9682956.1 hypothetical protein [Legionella maioricensis]MCL9686304.1 hypothetical protein [Legionella maioricensis]